MTKKRIYVKKAFIFKKDSTTQRFTVGSHIVDEEIANHPFVIAHLGEEAIDVASIDEIKALRKKLKNAESSLAELTKQLDEKNILISELTTSKLEPESKHNGDNKTKS